MAEYRIDIEKSAQNILDKIYERFGVSAERLVELAKADREGRCVVLPCKLGNWENPLVTHWMPLPELPKNK